MNVEGVPGVTTCSVSFGTAITVAPGWRLISAALCLITISSSCTADRHHTKNESVKYLFVVRRPKLLREGFKICVQARQKVTLRAGWHFHGTLC